MLVEPGSGDITLLLQQAASGDSRATERLADAVYAELRRIAGALMARERRDYAELSPKPRLAPPSLRLFINSDIRRSISP